MLLKVCWLGIWLTQSRLVVYPLIYRALYICVEIQPIKVGELFESINGTPKFCSTSKYEEDNFLLVQSQMTSNRFGCGLFSFIR